MFGEGGIERYDDILEGWQLAGGVQFVFGGTNALKVLEPRRRCLVVSDAAAFGTVPAGVLAQPRVQRVAVLLPIALLSALIALQTFTDGRGLVVDARLPGVAVAVVAQWRRAPFLVVVVSACATTALLRAVT